MQSFCRMALQGRPPLPQKEFVFHRVPLRRLFTDTFHPIMHDDVRRCPRSTHCSLDVGLVLTLVRNKRKWENSVVLHCTQCSLPVPMLLAQRVTHLCNTQQMR